MKIIFPNTHCISPYRMVLTKPVEQLKENNQIAFQLQEFNTPINQSEIVSGLNSIQKAFVKILHKNY